MHTDTAKYAHFTHQFLYGLVIDHKLLLQLFCNSPIAVTTFAFIVNVTYFSLISAYRSGFDDQIACCNSNRCCEGYPATSMSRPILNSCLGSHITRAFSLAVPARQPRHSIFKYAFSARRRRCSAIRSSSSLIFRRSPCGFPSSAFYVKSSAPSSR